MSKKAHKTAVVCVEPLQMSLAAWAREFQVDRSTLGRWVRRAGYRRGKVELTLSEAFHVAYLCGHWRP